LYQFNKALEQACGGFRWAGAAMGAGWRRPPAQVDPMDSLPGLAVIIPSTGDNMIRTQISLDKNEYDLAKAHAAALGISIAEFIRRAVREWLPVRGEGPWMKYAGFVATGGPRSSQSVDGIVYGTKG
jgi:hypothetical protein